MPNLWPQIEPLLLKVQKPSQYIGGEQNSVLGLFDPALLARRAGELQPSIVGSNSVPSNCRTITNGHSSVAVKVALAFPDTYAIGMSHWGLQVLYGLINSRADALCERAFAPWLDMEEVLRREKIPLFTLETHSPLIDFDVVGFSLQHELSYTNVLNMLDLAGIPLKSAERKDNHPLIIAGGPAAFNPEPLADFIDLFVIGDGEEKIIEVIEQLKTIKSQRLKRNEIIKHLAANISSLYAPSLYEITYNNDGTVKAINSKSNDVPSVIPKAVVADLDKAYYPVKPIIPFAEAVHDRITIEIMRGCPHDCRFCVSSVIKSPLRYRSLETCLKLAEDIYRNTGYDEISLLSLSSGDYPHLDELIYRLTARFKSRKVGISLPSMRVDSRLRQIPVATNVVRKSGFTLAPEAGTERLRKVISKNITDDDFFAAVRAAYEQGWRIIKLYFMIGLPTETDVDIEAIINMVRKTSELGREIRRQAGNVNVTISPFVPKPHTPFQWAPMMPAGEIARKQEMLRQGLRHRQVQLKFHDPRRSYIESVFARGDRRLGDILLRAWQAGCKFDAWDEVFDHSKWQSVFEQLRTSGFDPDFYALRGRNQDEVLPWSHINCGIAQDQLLKDWTETVALK